MAVGVAVEVTAGVAFERLELRFSSRSGIQYGGWSDGCSGG